MEVSLRKPQRLLFNKMKQNDGCYIRSYRKTITASRIYWRLMTKDHSPILNAPPGLLKPFFQLSLMDNIGNNQWRMKPDIELVEKKKKDSKKK